MILDALPYLLLVTTLAVRVMLARRMRLAWYVDLATVPPWIAFYVHAGAYPLIVLTLLFGVLDVRALYWWKRNA